MNLVSFVEAKLNPALVNRLSSVLGLPLGPVTRGLDAAVPAVLAGLASSVQREPGPQKLGNILESLDPALLRTYPALVASSARSSVISTGQQSLSALIGAPTSQALSTALGRYTGLAANQASALLGAITPLILAQLSRLRGRDGVSAERFVRMLGEQAPLLASAVPKSFAGLLPAGTLSGMGSKSPASYAPHGTAPHIPTAPASTHAGSTPHTQSSSHNTYSQTSEETVRTAAGYVIGIGLFALIIWRYVAGV